MKIRLGKRNNQPKQQQPPHLQTNQTKRTLGKLLSMESCCQCKPWLSSHVKDKAGDNSRGLDFLCFLYTLWGWVSSQWPSTYFQTQHLAHLCSVRVWRMKELCSSGWLLFEEELVLSCLCSLEAEFLEFLRSPIWWHANLILLSYSKAAPHSAAWCASFHVSGIAVMLLILNCRKRIF